MDEEGSSKCALNPYRTCRFDPENPSSCRAYGMVTDQQKNLSQTGLGEYIYELSVLMAIEECPNLETTVPLMKKI
jgi:Fe-S-cluster containining protein